jgi:hypothetical protein
VTNATLTGDVQISGQAGHLADAAVTDGVVHGPKQGDPVRVVDATGRAIGSISGATLEGCTLKAVPKHIPKSSKLYQALNRTPGKMVSWGMDLAKAPGSVSGGLGTAAPFYVLVAVIVFTGYYQQRQMTARTPASAQNPQMQMMGKIFPVFFGFISLQIPAGVGVYFATSNLWQIGQQAIIFRQQDKAEAGGKAPPKPPAASDRAELTGGDQAKPGDGDKANRAPAGPEPNSRDSGNSGGSGAARSKSRSSPRKRRRRR